LIQGATTIASTWLGTPLARSRKISSPGRAQDPRKARAIRTTTKCQTRSSILSMPPTSPAWIPRRHGPQPTREKRAQRAKYTPTGSREPLLSSSFACSPPVSRRWVGCVFVSRDAPWSAMERPNILLATVQEVGDAAFALRHAGLCQPASGLYKALAFSLSAFCRSSRTKGVCYGLRVL
jgi:hypothetical protein